LTIWSVAAAPNQDKKDRHPVELEQEAKRILKQCCFILFLFLNTSRFPFLSMDLALDISQMIHENLKDGILLSSIKKWLQIVRPVRCRWYRWHVGY
jgi:hypothetical protein